jgi:ribosomal protein L35
MKGKIKRTNSFRQTHHQIIPKKEKKTESLKPNSTVVKADSRVTNKNLNLEILAPK